MKRAVILAIPFLFLVSAAAPASGEERPRRIVSINLCTDYLTLLLADPEQIAALSWLASDPEYNPAAAMAASYPLIRGLTEEILPLKPDLVLAGSFTTRVTIQLLHHLGVTVVEVPYAASLQDVPRNIRLIADALGQRARGEAMIRDFEAGLARIGREAEDLSGDKPVAALYGMGGRVAGDASLQADVVKLAGYANLGESIGTWTTLSVEGLLRADPDLVVLSTPNPAQPSLAQEMLWHPALQSHFNGARLSVPVSKWMCEGPALIDAADAVLATRLTP